MHSLILLIAVTIIYILSIITTIKSGEYNFLLNLASVPLMTAVFFSAYETLLVFTVSAAFAVSLAVVGVKAVSIMHTISLLAVAMAGGYCLVYIARQMLLWKTKTLEVIKQDYRISHELNKKVEEESSYLEKMIYDISNLYQAPKRMTSSSSLEELLKGLKESLKGHFAFTGCRLLLFSFKEKEPVIDRVYNITDEIKPLMPSGQEESLQNIMSSRKEPLVIDRAAGMEPPEGFLLNEDVDRFVAAALFSGNRTNGIITIEGIPLEDMVRFVILAHQFSLVLERIRLYELVQEMAITDGLTGVSVRRYFLERLNEEAERAKHFNTPLSFMMIDIDHFKRCNDKYGHLVGDAVLKTVANILKRSVREIDLLGRYGGEEFSLMLPETAKKDAVLVGERLRKAVETQQISVYDEKIYLTISMGITTFPEDTGDINQLIDRADQTLYEAKETGRNRVMVYG